MSSVADLFLKYCKDAQCSVQENIHQALQTACVTGELYLAGQTLSVGVIAGLSASLRNSKQISVLNLADCMVGPPTLGGLLEALNTCHLRALNLHGNNISGDITAKLGLLLASNRTLKTLNLKWNNLGISTEAFAVFCNGLSQNESLEELDLRSNQLCVECAQHLGSIFHLNKMLKILDIRWNNIQNEGAEALLRGLENNFTLTSLIIQGNCVHREVALAIEECIKNHATIEKTNSECETKTNILLDRIKLLEESRCQQVTEIKERLTSQLEESSSRLTSLTQDTQEKQMKIEELESKMFILQEQYKTALRRSEMLEASLKDREKAYKEFQLMEERSMEKLRMEVKEEEDEQKQNLKLLEEQMHKNRLELETTQTTLELQTKENATLTKEITRLKTYHENELRQIQKDYDAEKKSWKSKMDDLDTSFTDQIQRFRSSAFDKQQHLEATILELTEKQSTKLLSMSERCERLKDEKSTLEERIVSLQNTASQLQRENSNLIAQMAEPAIKLKSLLDDLSNERILCQRLKQEKFEAVSEKDELSKQVDALRSQMSTLKMTYDSQEKTYEEELKTLKSKLKQLQQKVEDKTRKIDTMKSEEKARTKFLQSAFAKYFDRYNSPSKSTEDSV